MEEYKNKEYYLNEIMAQNRHQIIYAYDCESRKNFYDELGNMFPIKVDCNEPMAINLDVYGLKNISVSNNDIDNDKMALLSREYLTFRIIYSILLKSRENLDTNLLNFRMGKVLDIINKYYVNFGYAKIASIDELIKVIEYSIEFYKNYYLRFMENNIEGMSVSDIQLPFLELDLFISQYKKALNNSSYFGIIINKCEDISIGSTKALNSLIGARINKNLSVKLFVEPDKWSSYLCANGQFIEAVHDYGTVELDNSYKEYMRKLKGPEY